MVAPYLRESGAEEPEMTCICCNCHRERTPANEWRPHTPVAGELLTHGICPVCLYDLYPDLAPLVCPRG